MSVWQREGEEVTNNKAVKERSKEGKQRDRGQSSNHIIQQQHWTAHSTD